MSSLCSTVPKLSKSFAEKAVVDERSVGLEKEVYLSLSRNNGALCRTNSRWYLLATFYVPVNVSRFSAKSRASR